MTLLSEEQTHEHAGLVLATLCLASFMASLDVFVVNVALKDIGVGFGHSDLSNVSWVLNAYAIFFGALLVPAGRLADRFGRKNGFILGLAVFTIASAVCAASPALWALVLFRCVQAAGAAILVPSSLGLVLTTMPPARVQTSVRIWSVCGASAGAAGPVVGGLLTDVSWRWIFILNLPIGALALVAAVWLIPNVHHNEKTRIPDPVESLILILGIGALSLGLVKGPDWGWNSGRVIGSFAVAVVATLLFFVVNGRAETPVIDRAMFHSRTFNIALAAIIVSYCAISTEILGLSLFLENGWGWTAIAAGAGVAPGPIAVTLAAQAAHKLKNRIAIGTMTAIGFLFIAVGQAAVILTLEHSHNYWIAILPGWILLGLGAGLSVPGLIAASTADLPPRLSATGSAVNTMGRQLGSVLGTAILVAILGATVGHAIQGKFADALWVATALCVALIPVSLSLNPRARASTHAEGAPREPEPADAPQA